VWSALAPKRVTVPSGICTSRLPWRSPRSNRSAARAAAGALGGRDKPLCTALELDIFMIGWQF
jgi:hypothetical protein